MVDLKAGEKVSREDGKEEEEGVDGVDGKVDGEKEFVCEFFYVHHENSFHTIQQHVSLHVHQKRRKNLDPFSFQNHK